MSGLGAEPAATVVTAAGAGVAGALAAAAFIWVDEAEEPCSCFPQAASNSAHVIARNRAVCWKTFMLNHSWIGPRTRTTSKEFHAPAALASNWNVSNLPSISSFSLSRILSDARLVLFEHILQLTRLTSNVAHQLLTPPLPPTASGRYRSSSTRVARRRNLRALPAGESWCWPGGPRAWCSSAAACRPRQHRA
jgi:hypothetical protein